MIIRDEEDVKDRAGPGDIINKPEDAPPPQYEELDFSTQSSTAASSSSTEYGTPRSTPLQRQFFFHSESSYATSTSTVPPADSRAVNYISINKPLGSIDCTYLLDPTVQIPSSFLPKLEQGQTEEDRKNLSLKTKVGTITANIMLLHREGSVPTRRTSLEFKTSVGTIDLIIDAAPSPNRPPFHLRTVSQSGTVILRLPRTFRGFLTITTTIGSVTLSPEVIAATRWISTSAIGRVRKAFLGDSSTLRDVEIESWNGDEVVIETTVGSVEIHFVAPGPSPMSSNSRLASVGVASPSFVGVQRPTHAMSTANFGSAGGLAAPPLLAALLGYHNHRVSGGGSGG